MNHRRSQFSGNLIHVWNHQQQALSGGKCGGQRAALQSAVQGTGGPSFTLHFYNPRHRGPDICTPLRRPLIRQLTHGGRWSDWINSNNFIGFVGDVGGSFIPVNRDSRSLHHGWVWGQPNTGAWKAPFLSAASLDAWLLSMI